MQSSCSHTILLWGSLQAPKHSRQSAGAPITAAAFLGLWRCETEKIKLLVIYPPWSRGMGLRHNGSQERGVEET